MVMLLLAQIPTNCNLSSECRDLLMRLLERDQHRRISFEEFFDHPFIDLEHVPGPTCLGKAVSFTVLPLHLLHIIVNWFRTNYNYVDVYITPKNCGCYTVLESVYFIMERLVLSFVQDME